MTTEKLRGVNLGGWLILEKWMTPTLFAGTDTHDEYGLSGTVNGPQRIKEHRASFITEDDFRWMNTHGVNAVRIPIGYWSIEPDAPYISSLKELDWAMEMSVKYDLQVVLDLHGLKGSQNGQDHSGKHGSREWYAHAEYREQTLDTLEKLARRYRDYPTLWGIQIINEPKIGLLQLKLRRFYKEAYGRLDEILASHTKIIFSDGFTPRLLSGSLGKRSRAVMDVHLYHMSTPLSRFFSIEWFMNKTRQRRTFLRRLSRKQPIIIGEWSGTMRNDKLRSIPQQDHARFVNHYIDLQLKAYADVSGWFYWNYKTPTPGVWSFRSLVDDGIITLKD